MSTLSVSIAGTIYPIRNKSWKFGDKIEQSSQCNFTVQDDNNEWRFYKGQLVTVPDSAEGTIYSGSIHTVKRRTRYTTAGTTFTQHTIECVDLHAVPESRSSNKQYVGQYAGAILIDQINDLRYSGITANYAIDQDTSQGDFSSGTLTNVVAVSNIDDGNLELAPAGSIVSFTDGPFTLTATPTIKFAGTARSGFANNYSNKTIWSGSITIASGDSLSLDCFLVGPEYKCSIGFRCTDGVFFVVSTGAGTDSQGIGPDAKSDLNGLANNRWYHRNFGVSGSLIGKTISYFYLQQEGDTAGDYIAYFKNIVWNHSGGNTNIFNAGQNTIQTQGNLWRNGYDNDTLAVVDTYDNLLQQFTTHDISAAGIVKSSFLNWALSGSGSVLVETSVDNGASWQTATNKAAIPNLLAGMSVAGRSIQLRVSLLIGTDPTVPPQLDGVKLIVNPSYVASKSDSITSYTTATNFNTGALSNTRTVGSSSTPGLTLNGYTRNWDDADISNQTFYAVSGSQYVTNKQLTLSCDTGNDARSRLVFAGQPQNFITRASIVVHSNTSVSSGITYRTTAESNTNNSYAYLVEIYQNSIKLGYGTNSSGGGGSYTNITSVSVSLEADSVHVLEVEANGNTHTVRLNGIVIIDHVTDSTYSAGGYIGLRLRNSSGAAVTRTFDDFGVVVALTGTWQSPSIDISGPTTYGNSLIEWDANSIPNGTTITAETSINAGSSWQSVTNGGAISGLTVGQSLSGVSLLIRPTLTASSADVIPVLNGLTIWIMGQYSASGTRIAPALKLDAVGYCGSSLVAWNEIKPTGTGVTVATSTDGSSYTNVANGGSIAGINGQPSPTIDSFNLITSGSYINTARTGGTVASWVGDPQNSCLTVSGGTNALLVYGAISCKDVDEIFDLDQADNCGAIWRYTDPSNYYELLAYDGSSSAGATNVLKLFKVVSNVKTQLGADITVTLTRNKKYRVRVIMIGTAIAIYVDGASVRTTTDSALTGPGQCGLSSASGVARIYGLRIQPIGDDLTGKKVYNRITLTSTDPTVTPQVSDLTVLATSPNIGIGALVPTADYRITYKSDNINDLAKRSGYFWTIPASGQIIFNQRETIAAPWVLTSDDVLVAGIEVESSGDLYRNRHTIKGVIATLSTNETKIGDGVSTSFTLKYSVISVTSVTINGQPATFGPKGGATAQIYYEVGSTSLAVDASVGQLFQTDSVYIAYDGQVETSVTRDNTGQFPGTVSQADYIAQSGLTIPTLIILNQASATQSANGNSDDLDVSLCKNITVDINLTAKSGTNPTVQFFIDRKGADGVYYPIWQSITVGSTPTQLSTAIGAFCAYAQSLGSLIRIRWVIGGTSSPSMTFSISILGKLDASAAGIGVVEAIEDASGQNMNVAAAQDLADSRLQEHGVIGRTLTCSTNRTGLAAGQYLPVIVPEHNLNTDTLITSVERTQNLLSSGNQWYTFKITAVEGPALESWSKAMNKALTK